MDGPVLTPELLQCMCLGGVAQHLFTGTLVYNKLPNVAPAIVLWVCFLVTARHRALVALLYVCVVGRVALRHQKRTNVARQFLLTAGAQRGNFTAGAQRYTRVEMRLVFHNFGHEACFGR